MRPTLHCGRVPDDSFSNDGLGRFLRTLPHRKPPDGRRTGTAPTVPTTASCRRVEEVDNDRREQIVALEAEGRNIICPDEDDYSFWLGKAENSKTKKCLPTTMERQFKCNITPNVNPDLYNF